jgi:hypothetical protein
MKPQRGDTQHHLASLVVTVICFIASSRACRLLVLGDGRYECFCTNRSGCLRICRVIVVGTTPSPMAF